MNTRTSLIFSLVFALILTACAPAQVSVMPTSPPTAPPTDTSRPTPAPASTPLPPPPTPTPTPTPTPEPSTTPTRTPAPTSTSVIWPTVAKGSNPGLDRAVATLRNFDPKKQESINDETVNAAYKMIVNSGAAGALRLKGELAALQQAGEKDLGFELVAASILWDIGGVDEVDSITSIWYSIPAEDWVYLWLFMPAIQAAATQDPRVAPMLKVLLSDKEGKPYPMLTYPLTHEFVWGAYGSAGLPVLHEVLKTSDNPVALASSINLLAQAMYLPALPDIRQAMNHPDPGVQMAAILALGRFGHPDDFDTLVAGLSSKDPQLLNRYVYSLVEAGDLRAVPYLIPLLQNAKQRDEVAWGLSNSLASPEGLAALKAEALNSEVQPVLDSANLSWEAFQKLPEAEQRKVTEAYRFADITLKPGEKPVTHDELLQVVAEWKETGRISSQKWEWVETRHILPVAETDDINLLLDGKARFYLRVSDECLYETATVDELIKWIRRSGYRPDISTIISATPLPPTPTPSPSFHLTGIFQDLTTVSGNQEVAVSPDGRLLAIQADQRISLWDIVQNKEKQPYLTGHQDRITDLDFSPDGRWLVSAGFDQQAIVWSMAENKEVFRLKGHNAQIHSVAISPDNLLVATGDSDGVIILWNLSNGKEVARFDNDGDLVWDLEFSPDGKMLAATGDFLGSVNLFDVPQRIDNRKLIYNCKFTCQFYDLAFSPDSSLLAGVPGFGNPVVWDGRTGEQIGTINLEAADVGSTINFSPDGRVLIYTRGSKIHLVDVVTLQQVGELDGPATEFTNAQFLPDGRILARYWVSSGKTQIGIWTLTVSGAK